MAIKLLFDANFDNDIIRGLRLRSSTAEITRVQDIGLRTVDDDTILEWATNEGYLLVTSDIRTIEPKFKTFVTSGRSMTGVVLIRQGTSIGAAIDDLLLLIEASQPNEWDNQIIRLPLR